MKRGKRGHGRESSPKQTLNLPDLDQAKSAVLNSLPSRESQRGYRHAISLDLGRYARRNENSVLVTSSNALFAQSRAEPPAAGKACSVAILASCSRLLTSISCRDIKGEALG
jgi:hypothetical protein